MSYRCALNGGPADLEVQVREMLEDEIRVPAEDEPDGVAIYRLKRTEQGAPAKFGREYHYAYRYLRSSSDALMAEMDARAASMLRQGWRAPSDAAVENDESAPRQ